MQKLVALCLLSMWQDPIKWFDMTYEIEFILFFVIISNSVQRSRKTLAETWQPASQWPIFAHFRRSAVVEWHIFVTGYMPGMLWILVPAAALARAVDSFFFSRDRHEILLHRFHLMLYVLSRDYSLHCPRFWTAFLLPEALGYRIHYFRCGWKQATGRSS